MSALPGVGSASKVTSTPVSGTWYRILKADSTPSALFARSLTRSRTRNRSSALRTRLRGLQQELAGFNDEQSLVSAALSYCDLTNGPDGERLTPEQRIIDVEARYGADSPVTTGLRAAWPQLLDAVRRVEKLRRP